jgi:hypothetical protein
VDDLREAGQAGDGVVAGDADLASHHLPNPVDVHEAAEDEPDVALRQPTVYGHELVGHPARVVGETLEGRRPDEPVLDLDFAD